MEEAQAMKPTEPGPLIDWSAALEATADDKALLDELVTVFLEEAPRLLQQIHTAFEQRHSKDFQRGAHTLKGSLRIFGAARGVELAQQLEQFGERNQLDDVGPLLTDLDACIAQAMVELKQQQR